MATLDSSTSQAKPMFKKGEGSTQSTGSAVPPKTKETSKKSRRRRGGNLSLSNNSEQQHQELAGLPTNHIMAFVAQSMTIKPRATSPARSGGTSNRRANNRSTTNMDRQQTLVGPSNQRPPSRTSATNPRGNSRMINVDGQQPLVAGPSNQRAKGKGRGRKGRERYPEKPPLDHEAHLGLVVEAAQKVTEIMRNSSISCAVFGSLASKLYGCPRTPKDVDMLVSQEPVAESSSDSNDKEPNPVLDAAALKNLILQTNSQNFYLKMPRDPEAEYRILWYRRHPEGPECKVDILVPGTMHLPFLPAERVVWKEGVPLVPFSLLLFHKLQGWDDHCKAEEAHYRRRHPQDAADVRRLLSRAEQMGELKKSSGLDDQELFTVEFRELTIGRVKRYCDVYQERAERWKMLGFEVS